MLSLNTSILGRSLRLHCPSTVYLKNLRFCSESSDDEKATKKPDKDTKESKKVEAKKKLNQLLELMVKEDVIHAKSKLELAKPKRKRGEGKLEKGTESVTTENANKKLISAVKNVAAAIAGDATQIESELLSKLLNSTKLEQFPQPIATLSEIVKGMKIDRTEKPEAASRAEQVRRLVSAVQEKPQVQINVKTRQRKRSISEVQTLQNIPIVPIDLFGAEPLGIFTRDGESSVAEISEHQQSTWDMLHERDLRLAVTHPPSNYFQQMIQWTDQGKLWQFPIDNEQGMDTEHSVYFTEHVFLEPHLEPWCPPRGPVRQFMELVCVGMSKNPYMSANRKREHIDWYRDYFTERRQLLQDIGAGVINTGNETIIDAEKIGSGDEVSNK